MSHAYFQSALALPGSTGASVSLNGGQARLLQGLVPGTTPEFVSYDVGPNKDVNVLGLTDENTVVITTTGTDSISWSVKVTGIDGFNDIQFLVFENKLVGRQGPKIDGFDITKN
ncbi:hypothetical protein L0664_04955 [Octadecabacter sp. G9-8]|uniref:Uncharacterized protein n=1 Tax=Octadecabacter dasysiphoniae TaxID=2909341 RepID=A0ABS9CWJ4_9RHOB|nr:hypothetical protein [Octadecabacter dasysiphoniae]MCF2870408.1 hypothetical protein [Octadecabacter dasysiphoniae]